jgi:hypothetical protein
MIVLTDERSIDRSRARSEMFLSEALFSAIQADREREIEQRNRDWRLLHPDPAIVAETPQIRSLAGTAHATRAPRRATSSGSACEAV